MPFLWRPRWSRPADRHFDCAFSPSSTSLLTSTVEPSARLSEQQLAAPASPKSIETTQPLILLFHEFAIGDDLCGRRFWFRVWWHDTVVAIEPLFRCVFDGEATSQLFDYRLRKWRREPQLRTMRYDWSCFLSFYPQPEHELKPI
jgi:hypothetical protein